MFIFADEKNGNGMTETELSIKLREDARRIGLCDEWYGRWKDSTSKEELVWLYKRGLDFCIKNRWPSISFIKQHFTQEFLRNHGILIDDIRSYPIRNAETRRLHYIKEFVLWGRSQAIIRYSFRPHMCNVWACDNSHVKAYVKYGAFIMIHLFDNATADVKTDLVSKVTVIRHSMKTKVKKEGIVTIKDEFDYLD